MEAYYDQYDESKRLTQDHVHQVEFRTTMFLLERYLPAGGRVLDACAGTGIYAFELAKRGFQVTAGDIVPKHVRIMQADPRRSALRDVYDGSITDLSRFADASFEVVLNMGAMYHLQTARERDDAMDECLRVLTPGGVLAVAYMQPCVLYIAQLMRAIRAADVRTRLAEYAALEKVVHEPKTDVFFAMTAEEAQMLCTRHGLSILTAANTYSLLYPLYPELNDMPEVEFEAYIRCQCETCEDPNVLAHAMHGLVFARKTP